MNRKGDCAARRAGLSGAAAAAALVLVVGMGIGRFAFTGLYPQMVREGVLSVNAGSYAAAANNAGYLLGALFAGLFPSVSSRRKSLLALAATVAGLAVLACPLAPALVVALRGLAGIASAVAMVSASHWLLHDQGDRGGAPLLYCGVGIGIGLSAELIAAGRSLGLDSAWNWLVIAASATLLTGIAAYLMRRAAAAGGGPAVAAHAFGTDAGPTARRLTAIYALSGFGGSITMAYLPLLVRGSLGNVDPVHVWGLFGLVAVPSSFLWHAVHERWGARAALAANLVAQSIGVGLPAACPGAMGYASSAILVGGAFMGTVTIVLPAARRVAHTVRFNIMSIMSASYGAGLIAGPLVAAAVFERTQSFDGALYCAVAALLLGAGLAAGARR